MGDLIMDIKKLPSLDFSNSVAPLAIGDKCWDDKQKVEFTVDPFCLSVLGSTNRDATPFYFIVSYADRQNTGKQPVADGVRVNMKNDADPFPARFIFWDSRTDETWKPNHAYMVKAYQESIKDTKMNTQKEQAHHIALQTEALGDAPKLDMVVNPDDVTVIKINGAEYSYEKVSDDEMGTTYHNCKEIGSRGAATVALIGKEWPSSERQENIHPERVHIDADGDLSVDGRKVKVAKPIYTQTMMDAGESPFAGSIVDSNLWVGEVLNVRHNGSMTVVAIMCTEGTDSEFNIGWVPLSSVRPIKTDEDKLRDAIMGEIDKLMSLNIRDEDSIVNDDTQVGAEAVIDFITDNPLFTITLNK